MEQASLAYSMEGGSFSEVVEAVSRMDEKTKDWTLDEWISKYATLTKQFLSFFNQKEDLQYYPIIREI
ncbi:hypothetical protein JNUCC42_20095 [Brevibacterium sp. JNUCC-42]|nr:hypothetical protein JNUCC42_20095 [Brevibacterium sp. JNUCC-42]